MKKRIVRVTESELRTMIGRMLNEQQPHRNPDPGIGEPEIYDPEIEPGTDEPDIDIPERKPKRDPFAVPPHIRPGQEPQPRAQDREKRRY